MVKLFYTHIFLLNYINMYININHLDFLDCFFNLSYYNVVFMDFYEGVYNYHPLPSILYILSTYNKTNILNSYTSLQP